MFRALLFLALISVPLRAEIVVSAAASLEDVLADASVQWRKRGGEVVRLNLGPSHALALQIESGAPADVFVSAAESDIDRLQSRDLLVPSSRRAIASNPLVVIVPRSSTLRIRDARHLSSASVRRFVIADPETSPAGMGAKQFLVSTGVWTPLARRVIPAADVRGALAIVASGAADAGIVFRTDALSSPEVRIAFQPRIAPIRYTGAVIRRSAPKAAAKAFLEFLASPAGKAIFRNHGFGPPGPE